MGGWSNLWEVSGSGRSNPLERISSARTNYFCIWGITFHWLGNTKPLSLSLSLSASPTNYRHFGNVTKKQRNGCRPLPWLCRQQPPFAFRIWTRLDLPKSATRGASLHDSRRGSIGFGSETPPKRLLPKRPPPQKRIPKHRLKAPWRVPREFRLSFPLPTSRWLSEALVMEIHQ